jgi:hypothetical protein
VLYDPSIDSITTPLHPFCLNSSFAASIIIPPHPKMSVYLKPLAIPSRNNSSMSDDSPYTTSPAPSDPWSSPTTRSSRRLSEGTHFLGIPGPSAPHIKDADSVDKEANAAAAAAAATASSSPLSGECRKSKTIQSWRQLTSGLIERAS